MEVLPFEKNYELLKQNFIKEIDDYFRSVILSPEFYNYFKNDTKFKWKRKIIFQNNKYFKTFNYKKIFTLDNNKLVFCSFVKNNINIFNFYSYKSLDEINIELSQKCKKYIEKNLNKNDHIVKLNDIISKNQLFLAEYEFIYEFKILPGNYIIKMELKDNRITFKKLT